MPASTVDPITSVLKHAFNSNGGSNGGRSSSPASASAGGASASSSSSLVESKLLSTAKKTLLSSASVAFDPPVRQIGGALKKGTFIFLNPGGAKKASASNAQSTSKDDPSSAESPEKKGPPAPPVPRRVFFPPQAVEVGYRANRTPGAGMFNMGNTCYLNSTLQALFHTPALFNYLMSGVHQAKCRQQHGGNGFLQTCMICALTATLRETLQSSVTRPSKIYDKLKLICKHLVHGRQEDAHEFLRYLIESLQRSFLNSAVGPGAPQKGLDSASRETTPFNQIFGGYMRQDVVCLRCKYVSVTFQHFMDLLLDIRQASTIDDALEHYFRAERIGGGGPMDDGGGMYKCEKCKTKVPAKKRSYVCRPPIVLCIQLKRFSLMGGKISRTVQLSRTLRLGRFVRAVDTPASASDVGGGPPELTYRLVSMITHVGPSPNCGHYTAIGQAGSSDGGQFFQFDDSSVRPIPMGQVCNQFEIANVFISK